MIRRKLTISTLLVGMISLTGCNDSPWTKPPNVVGSGIVESIEKTSTSSWVRYEVKLRDAEPSDLDYLFVSGSRIVDSDIRPSIGRRVAVKCYRDPHDYCYVSSYGYEGRDLDVQSK
jgi:hypothetical protein